MRLRDKLIYSLIILVGFLLFTLKYGSQGYYRSKNSSLSNVYQSSFYYNLKESIQSSNKAILFGHKADGVQEFLENYLNHEAQRNKSVEILWREVRAGHDIDFRKHPVFSFAYQYLKLGYDYLINQKHSLTKLWVFNNIEAPCYSINKRLGKFVVEHSHDKILILCRKDKVSFKKTISKNSYIKSLRFQIFVYTRPPVHILIKGLSKYSSNQTILKNMITYYENDLSKINHLFLGENPINFFLTSFQEEFTAYDVLAQDPKTSSFLMKLCKKGEIKHKHNETFILHGSSIVSEEEEKIFWSSYEALFAYQIKNNIECMVPMRYAEPREIITIPELDMIYPMFTKSKASNEDEEEL